MSAQTMVAFNEGWKRIYNDGVLVLEEYLQSGKVQEQEKSSGKEVKQAGQTIFSRSDYSELYTIVYDMCTQRRPNNWSQHLYQKYGETMTSYITNKVLKSLNKKAGVDLLKELARAWSNHQIYVKWMSRFFMYLDRYYVKLQAVPSLSCKGYNIFHAHIFTEVAEETRSALLQVIHAERENENLGADGDLVKKVCSIFIELGQISLDQPPIGSLNHSHNSGLLTYNAEFERYFLPNSKDYYSRKSAGWLEKHSFPEYLLCAERALKSEQTRVRNYLHPTTDGKLKTMLIEAMFNATSRRILLDKPTSITFLLENNKKEDLQRAHRLFGFVEGGLVPIASLFKAHVTAAGNSIVDERLERANDPNMKKTDLQNDPDFIQKLLDLHEHYKNLVQTSFSQDSLFQKSLKEAFEVFVNRDLGKASVACLMSSFCNRLLKKSGPQDRLPDDEIESRLTKIVELFNFLSDKDMFSDIYRQQLAKRLLEESSASDDAERSLVGKLKLKCGAQFTSKLEGMLNDLTLAGEHKKRFENWCRDENKLDLSATSSYDGPVINESTGELEPQAKIQIEFGVTVLATGYWPTYSGLEISLPKQMSTSITIFQHYYATQTQHRKLTWIHHLGQATVACTFKGNSAAQTAAGSSTAGSSAAAPVQAGRGGERKHDLVGSTLQTIVLLLYAQSGVNGQPETEHTMCSIQKALMATPSSSSSSAAQDAKKEQPAGGPNSAPLDMLQLKRVLGTLTCSKHKILSTRRNGEIVAQPKTLMENDVFIVNEDFQCDRKRVRLPTASASNEDTNKGGQERVEEDRSIAVEAAIVRIMKARRTLLHAQLVAEVLQQLHFFRPEPKLIKHRIEHLIDREYLERDSDNSNCYRYLA